MPESSIVMDAGPLILLARIGSLSILRKLPFRYVAPPNVMRELAAGIAFGHPVVDAPWLETRELREPLSPYLRMALDEGEAAAIQLAVEQGISFVCLDDRRGRRMAKSLGLEVTGLLGLLVRAKRLGVIGAVRPYADKLTRAGARYAPALLRDVFENVGEGG